MASPESQARLRLGYLLSKIASGAPAPASGSAAAAVVATAAALLQKVAIRSQRWPGSGATHSRAEALRLRAEELVELDSIAYLTFVDAVRSGSEVEAARARIIEVPREIAAAAAEVAGLARDLEANGNRNLKADAQAAAILARAAARTAEMLVRVNESARPRAARGPAGDRGRAPARSRGSDRQSPPRTARDDRSARSADRRQGSSRSRSASAASPSTRRAPRRGGSR
ncbi:MAG: hypothetical protein E6J28_07400 [Chloroflexi bacterium]|nr:MAG: hypothetical protein E6J28_07400 [Chloroflexota bacterium]